MKGLVKIMLISSPIIFGGCADPETKRLRQEWQAKQQELEITEQQEREREIQDMKDFLEKTRPGVVTYIGTDRDFELRREYDGAVSYSNPSQLENREYIMKVNFPQNQIEQNFRIIACDKGPDFGHPAQVLPNFKEGDPIEVRISNGIRVHSNKTVDRYPKTTHLDKGHVENGNANPTNYQTKCAGAFRVPRQTIAKLDTLE